MSKRPNFFIVGAPKCGTTALAQYLGEHPNVFVSDPKEPFYFTRHLILHDLGLDPPPHRRSLDGYLALFADAGEEHLAVGEASTTYLGSEEALREIHAFDPEAKIIVMLRNPVDLAYSLHSQKIYEGEEIEKDFAKAWRLQDERALGRQLRHNPTKPSSLLYGAVSRLGTQLETLLGIYDRENVKWIFLDDLTRNPADLYAETLQFLDVPSIRMTEFPKVNSNKVYSVDLLGRLVQRPPRPLFLPYMRLKKILGLQHRRLGLRSAVARRITRYRERPPMPPHLRRELAAYFAEEVAKLEELTGRDLTDWRG